MEDGVNTFETCPDIDALERQAHAFAAARFGKLPAEMSASRARDYIAKGWGYVLPAQRAGRRTIGPYLG